ARASPIRLANCRVRIRSSRACRSAEEFRTVQGHAEFFRTPVKNLGCEEANDTTAALQRARLGTGRFPVRGHRTELPARRPSALAPPSPPFDRALRRRWLAGFQGHRAAQLFQAAHPPLGPLLRLPLVEGVGPQLLV